jgi:hypothetical protein
MFMYQFPPVQVSDGDFKGKLGQTSFVRITGGKVKRYLPRVPQSALQ